MVSVIVPIYNRDKYLIDCIESPLNQTYKDYEIILVDDGSTDKFGIICDEYADKFQNITVFHTVHVGFSCARNNGLNHAQVDLIMFCDSDDTTEPTWIAFLSSAMDDSNVVMGCSSFSIYKNRYGIKNIQIEGLDSSFLIKDFPFYISQYRLNTLWHCCFRKSECRFHEELSYGEDSIFILEYILEYPCNTDYRVKYVDKSLYNYYFGSENSLSGLKATRLAAIEYKSNYFNGFLKNTIIQMKKNQPYVKK